MTIEKFTKIEEWMQRLHDLRHAGLSRISRRQTRPDLHRLGDPDPQHPRLERPVLPDDRRPLFAATQEMLEKVQWDKYGVVDGVARDPRCENCMVHCGYDPTASLGLHAQRGDTWKTYTFQFRREAEADRHGQRDRGLQRRDLRQRPSHRQESRAGRAGFLANTWRIPPRMSSRCRAPSLNREASLSRVSNAELAEAIARAQQNLLRQQKPDGHWVRRAARR